MSYCQKEYSSSPPVCVSVCIRRGESVCVLAHIVDSLTIAVRWWNNFVCVCVHTFVYASTIEVRNPWMCVCTHCGYFYQSRSNYRCEESVDVCACAFVDISINRGQIIEVRNCSVCMRANLWIFLFINGAISSVQLNNIESQLPAAHPTPDMTIAAQSPRHTSANNDRYFRESASRFYWNIHTVSCAPRCCWVLKPLSVVNLPNQTDMLGLISLLVPILWTMIFDRRLDDTASSNLIFHRNGFYANTSISDKSARKSMRIQWDSSSNRTTTSRDMLLLSLNGPWYCCERGWRTDSCGHPFDRAITARMGSSTQPTTVSSLWKGNYQIRNCTTNSTRQLTIAVSLCIGVVYEADFTPVYPQENTIIIASGTINYITKERRYIPIIPTKQSRKKQSILNNHQKWIAFFCVYPASEIDVYFFDVLPRRLCTCLDEMTIDSFRMTNNIDPSLMWQWK